MKNRVAYHKKMCNNLVKNFRTKNTTESWRFEGTKIISKCLDISTQIPGCVCRDHRPKKLRIFCESPTTKNTEKHHRKIKPSQPTSIKIYMLPRKIFSKNVTKKSFKNDRLVSLANVPPCVHVQPLWRATGVLHRARWDFRSDRASWGFRFDGIKDGTGWGKGLVPHSHSTSGFKTAQR